jgi:hypothetical protein
LIVEPQIQFVNVKIGSRSKVKVYTYNNSWLKNKLIFFYLLYSWIPRTKFKL